MSFSKEVYYDVIYKDITSIKKIPQIKSFKDRKRGQLFFDSLDSGRYDKYFIMYEKTILDVVYSKETKKRILEF